MSIESVEDCAAIQFSSIFLVLFVREPLKVENVYKVDEIFFKVINGLETAVESGMDPEEFDRIYGNMKATFENFRGEEVNILALNTNNGTNSSNFGGYNGYSTNHLHLPQKCPSFHHPESRVSNEGDKRRFLGESQF
ncbi:hypothetical protein M9Y10_029540 [Tritrichomonas musculus]|uniref:Uncharacterized protein n=1 Tax=Tritrichomonas musculus TaxID=1915356 RepID=A0ABR2KME8_9EUKA